MWRAGTARWGLLDAVGGTDRPARVWWAKKTGSISQLVSRSYATCLMSQWQLWRPILCRLAVSFSRGGCWSFRPQQRSAGRHAARPARVGERGPATAGARRCPPPSHPAGARASSEWVPARLPHPPGQPAPFARQGFCQRWPTCGGLLVLAADRQRSTAGTAPPESSRLSGGARQLAGCSPVFFLSARPDWGPSNLVSHTVTSRCWLAVREGCSRSRS